MNTPLVSVNLTTYNRAHLLPRALDSILAQTYREFEIVVVDDCSQDNTAEVVNGYQRKGAPIKYFHHAHNKGNAFARNTALRHCTGHYVAFMDDDDEWIDADKIKKQVECFEKDCQKKLAIVCSSVRLYSSKSQYVDKQIYAPKNLKSRILSGNGIIYSPTVMTPKKVLEEVGGFDADLSRGVDSDFYRTCIVKRRYHVFFLPDVTTAIHEYGDDRMTPVTTLAEANEVMKNNVYIIQKFFFGFLMHPSALAKRFWMVLSKYKCQVSGPV